MNIRGKTKQPNRSINGYDPLIDLFIFCRRLLMRLAAAVFNLLFRRFRFVQQHLYQTRKALIQIFLSQRVEMFFALKARLDQAGLAQNLDMVRQRRFGYVLDFEAGTIFLA